MAIDEEPAAPISAEAPTDAAAPERPARKRHVTRGIMILMILTVAGVVAPFVAAIFARHSGASLDSTRVFQVSIRNDTAAPLDAQLHRSLIEGRHRRTELPEQGRPRKLVRASGKPTEGTQIYLLAQSRKSDNLCNLTQLRTKT